MKRSKTKLVAICGIDGAGKTTLLRELTKKDDFKEAAFVRKEFRDNVELIKKYHHRDLDGGKEWTEGSFSKAAALGASYDFLQHYETIVKPKLSGNIPLIVCDRYALCFEAYMHSVGIEETFIKNFYANIKQPDFIIYIDIPLSKVRERYETRGGPAENETCDSIRLFKESYDILIREYPVPVRIVTNDRPLNETIKDLEVILSNNFLSYSSKQRTNEY